MACTWHFVDILLQNLCTMHCTCPCILHAQKHTTFSVCIHGQVHMLNATVLAWFHATGHSCIETAMFCPACSSVVQRLPWHQWADVKLAWHEVCASSFDNMTCSRRPVKSCHSFHDLTQDSCFHTLSTLATCRVQATEASPRCAKCSCCYCRFQVRWLRMSSRWAASCLNGP